MQRRKVASSRHLNGWNLEAIRIWLLFCQMCCLLGGQSRRSPACRGRYSNKRAATVMVEEVKFGYINSVSICIERDREVKGMWLGLLFTVYYIKTLFEHEGKMVSIKWHLDAFGNYIIFLFASTLLLVTEECSSWPCWQIWGSQSHR